MYITSQYAKFDGNLPFMTCTLPRGYSLFLGSDPRQVFVATNNHYSASLRCEPPVLFSLYGTALPFRYYSGIIEQWTGCGISTPSCELLCCYHTWVVRWWGGTRSKIASYAYGRTYIFDPFLEYNRWREERVKENKKRPPGNILSSRSCQDVARGVDRFCHVFSRGVWWCAKRTSG